MTLETVTLPTISATNVGFCEFTEPTLLLSNSSEAKVAAVDYGQYANLTWSNSSVPSHVGTSVSWGSKTLPGAGPFYYTNQPSGSPTLGHLEQSNQQPD